MSIEQHAEKGKRSKSGCWTCRGKKVKCDEHRPTCHRCQRLNLLCDYSPRNKNPRTRFIDASALVMRRLQKANNSKSQQNTPAINAALVRAMDQANTVPQQITQKLQTSANSLQLSSADHEAIRYFRKVFAMTYHSKNPGFSLYAIIVDIAERDPMVMRAILALGGQSMEHRRQVGMAVTPATTSATTQHPLQHYSAALRMMADALDQREAYIRFLYDLDAILATLYLMLLYEKAFGVGDGLGLSNHLQGVAHLIEHRLQGKSGPPPLPRRNLLAQTTVPKENNVALVRSFDDKQREEQSLSLFSARILVHLAVQDSTASTFGFGGRLLTTLNELAKSPDTKWPFADGVMNMQYYSRALYPRMWRGKYPQKEMLDDLENRAVYDLGATLVQVRFAVSTLTTLPPTEAKGKVAIAQDAINQIFVRFEEIFAIAKDLSPDTDNSHRLVANIRGTVPLYYVVQIELCRAKRVLGFSDDDSELIATAIDNIMRIARQIYRHEGSDGLPFCTSPMYYAALETTDEDDRQWILDRFKKLRELGKNFERAYNFLARCFPAQAGGSSAASQETVNIDQKKNERFIV